MQRCQSFGICCQDLAVDTQYLPTKAAVLLPHPIAHTNFIFCNVATLELLDRTSGLKPI